MTAACPVPRANSRAASKRRASNAATSRRPWRVLAMPQHGIVPDDDHQSISRESLEVGRVGGSLLAQGLVEGPGQELVVLGGLSEDPALGHLTRKVLQQLLEWLGRDVLGRRIVDVDLAVLHADGVEGA